MRLVVLVPLWDLIVIWFSVTLMFFNSLPLQKISTVLWLSNRIHKFLRLEYLRQKMKSSCSNVMMSPASIKQFLPSFVSLEQAFSLCSSLLQLQQMMGRVPCLPQPPQLPVPPLPPQPPLPELWSLPFLPPVVLSKIPSFNLASMSREICFVSQRQWVRMR